MARDCARLRPSAYAAPDTQHSLGFFALGYRLAGLAELAIAQPRPRVLCPESSGSSVERL